MMQIVNYQSIINTLAGMLVYAIPIGLIFGVARKACKMFISMALGKGEIKF